jgi:hypothetical protein
MTIIIFREVIFEFFKNRYDGKMQDFSFITS